MTHVHQCPHCYAREECAEACHIEPDLGVTPSLLPYGFHHPCGKCEPKRDPSRAYVPTDEQAQFSALCLAMATQGATEEDVIAALFEENQALRHDRARLLEMQPPAPFVIATPTPTPKE
jgi:hypothetical protein